VHVCDTTVVRRSILIVLSCGAIVTSCARSHEPTPSGPGSVSPTSPAPPVAACSFLLQVSAVTFNASGGSASATVTTEPGCRWRPSVDSPSWIRVDNDGPLVGAAAVTLSIGPNRSSDGRSGVLTINGEKDEAPARQSVTQRGAGCLYSVDPSLVTLDWLGTSDGSDVGLMVAHVHAVPSDCRWTATPTDPWIKLDTRLNPATSTGDGKVLFSVFWNGPTRRHGSIVISGLSGVNPDARMIITQEPR
jgi:hypothetical protein